ncbi:MAG: hypothetical protein WDN23_01670 [Edaphobacter sp.]
MVDRKSLEHLLSLGRDLKQDTATVCPSLSPHDQASLLTSIPKFHHRVMAQSKTLSQIADRHRVLVRRAGDLKKQLMLLRLQSGLQCCRFAELKKQAKLVAKFSEYLKPLSRCGRSWCVLHS